MIGQNLERMNTRRIFSLVALACIFFQSCVSDKSMDAAKVTAEYFGAKSYSVANNFSSDEKSCQIISFENFDSPLADWSEQQIASSLASKFINTLKEKSTFLDSCIEIVAVFDTRKISRTFTVSNLEKVPQYNSFVKLFFETASRNEDVLAMFDTSFVPKKSVEELLVAEVKFSSKQDSVQFRGFERKNISKSQEPVITVFVRRNVDGLLIDYKFIFVERTKRIVYFERL